MHVLDALLLAVCAGLVIALVAPAMRGLLFPMTARLARLGILGAVLSVLALWLAFATCAPKSLLSLARSVALLRRGHMGLFLKLLMAGSLYVAITVLFFPDEAPSPVSLMWTLACLCSGLALGSLWAWLILYLQRRVDTSEDEATSSAPADAFLWNHAPLQRLEDDKYALVEVAETVADQLWGPQTTDSELCPSVALIGPYGSGKTTVCNFVRDLHRERRRADWPDVVFARFEAWKYDRPEAALRSLVGTAVSAISQRVDELAMLRVPHRFVRAVSERTGAAGKLLGGVVGALESPDRALQALGDTLVRLGMRLAIFVDDLDRIEQSSAACLGAIVHALNGFGCVLNVQLVVAIAQKAVGPPIDLLKLTQFTCHIPALGRELALDVVCEVRDETKRNGPTFLPWASQDDQPGDPIVYRALAGFHIPQPLGRALHDMLGTPRRLHAALRLVTEKWRGGLRGEINWYDALLLCALSVAKPGLYRWIERERYLFREGKRSPLENGEGELADYVTRRLKETGVDSGTREGAAALSAVNRLFPKWARILDPRGAGVVAEGDASAQRIDSEPGYGGGISYLDRFYDGRVRDSADCDTPTLEYLQQLDASGFDRSAFTSRYLSTHANLVGPLNKLVQFSPWVSMRHALKMADAILEWVSVPANAAVWPEPANCMPAVMQDAPRILLRAEDAEPDRSGDPMRRTRVHSRAVARFLRTRVRKWAEVCPLVSCELIRVFEDSIPASHERESLVATFLTGFVAKYVDGSACVLRPQDNPRWYLRRLLYFLPRFPDYAGLRPKLTRKLLRDARAEGRGRTRAAVAWTLARGAWPPQLPEESVAKLDKQSHPALFDMNTLLPELKRWRQTDFGADPEAWHALALVLASY